MDEKVEAFLKVLDPANNATGGGTASAVAGAMAAGLVGMVARLSIGREGMEPEAYYREINAQAEVLTAELFEGGREDAAAFDTIRAAYKLPKQTAEEKAARSQAIQQATVYATHVPLANAERCRRTLDLAARLRGRSNVNVVSDLECAEYLARAGVLGCTSNVRANVQSIKDQSVAAELAERARALASDV